MRKMTFTIGSNTPVARDTFRIVLRTDTEISVRSGQFVEIGLDGYYLRRPISISDSLPDGVILYYKVVGEGTRLISRMKEGETLELLLPLGKGFNPEACASKALLIGGGIGSAPLYLLAKELLNQGKEVTVVLGFNKADEICLRDEFQSLGIPVHIATMDGSVGTKGFVTDAIDQVGPEFDRFYTCGPLPMMKAVRSALSAPGEMSLEERMGCGAGFCYGCSVQTTKGPKRVCADGPVFDKEDLLW
ncbi:MAG: dihydroorotate dehydrogenase electron transfer subunit [Bacteroidales bacterium]|nr:dihydroorotate dehydrogenase electron transfer subunit [Bacteroidales bacterium]